MDKLRSPELSMDDDGDNHARVGRFRRSGDGARGCLVVRLPSDADVVESFPGGSRVGNRHAVWAGVLAYDVEFLTALPVAQSAASRNAASRIQAIGSSRTRPAIARRSRRT
jgi:hypothetical protein